MIQQQGYPPPGYYQQPQVVIVQAGQVVNVLGVVSLVLGVLGLLTSCLGLGLILGGIGLIFGVVGLFAVSPNTSRGSAIAGVILCAIPSFIGLLMMVGMIGGIAGMGGRKPAVTTPANSPYTTSQPTTRQSTTNENRNTLPK